MIHPDDDAALQRMIGKTELPADVQEEYEIRATMFHRNGGTGPLRGLALVDLVRFLGYMPPRREKPSADVDWRKYPTDGSVQVEARFYGAWMPGRFLGFVEHGTLAVRLDEDSKVRECRKDMVRLVGIEEKLRPDADDKPDARADLLEDDEPPAPTVAPNLDATDWSEVAEGTAVWVDNDGDIEDAVFLRAADDKVIVRTQRNADEEFAADKVTYAGA